jgi:DNA-binding response OmpR family regulator
MSGHAATSGPGPPLRLLLADTDDAALEMAGQERPDLIILDLSLPGVVDLIRALRQAAATPILLLTWPTEPDRQAALDAGAHDALTLSKPFGIGQLLERLQAPRTPAYSPPGQDKEHATGADAPWTPS